MEKDIFGIQLYSIRNEIKERGFDEMLGVVKEAGYDTVEFAGFYGYTPRQVKDLLDKHGLTGLSAHIRLDQIEENLEYIDLLGIKTVYIPWCGLEDLKNRLPELIEEIKRVKKILDGRGVTFGYHNHAQEYTDGADYVYDLITAVDGFTSELDIFWAKAGGYEPTFLMKKYGKGLSALHIKEMDVRADEKNPREFPNAIVGEGKSGCEEAIKLAKEMGVHTFILEVEGFPCDVSEYLRKSCENMKKFAQ